MENGIAKGISPNLGIAASGSAESTTKSVISPGNIEIRSNPNQDISKLSRDTSGAVNSLGKIFDKKTVQEQKELANLFGQEAFKAIGDLKLKDGSTEKVALDTFAGALIAKLGGSNPIAGAAGAGFNELLINEIGKIKDPALREWASLIVGNAAAKLFGGDPSIGGSIAILETRFNYNLHEYKVLRESLEKLRSEHLNFAQKIATLPNKSSTDALNTIMQYNDVIDNASSASGVPIEMVQAVLFREQIFYNVIDSTDVARVNIGISKTASVGLGQIFPDTAIQAEREITGSSYTQEEMFQRLQDNKTNIYYVAIVLAAEAKRLGVNLNTDGTDGIQRVLAKYNGIGDEAANYGRETLKYYDVFKSYNNR